MLDLEEKRQVPPPGLQPVGNVLSSCFLDNAVRELADRGFVTDEHDFAPYRETMAYYVRQIEQALRERGERFSLGAGEVTNHPDAGYAYFIYDTARFSGLAAAEKAVSSWLSEVYAANKEA